MPFGEVWGGIFDKRSPQLLGSSIPGAKMFQNVPFTVSFLGESLGFFRGGQIHPNPFMGPWDLWEPPMELHPLRQVLTYEALGKYWLKVQKFRRVSTTGLLGGALNPCE